MHTGRQVTFLVHLYLIVAHSDNVANFIPQTDYLPLPELSCQFLKRADCQLADEMPFNAS
jgi:hypothetical protein